MATSKHYIDGKVLKEELHDFAKSYKIEAKEIYQEASNDPMFIESLEKSVIDETLKGNVTLNKLQEESLKLKPSQKKMKKEEKLMLYLERNEYCYDRKVKLLRRNLYYKVGYKQASGTISEDLGEMFLSLAQNLANKKNWINYTYKDEMIGRGVLYLCQYAHSYNKNFKRANAFAYVTQICKNGFLQARETEDKQSVIKDKLIKRSMESTELERWNSEEYV